MYSAAVALAESSTPGRFRVIVLGILREFPFSLRRCPAAPLRVRAPCDSSARSGMIAMRLEYRRDSRRT